MTQEYTPFSEIVIELKKICDSKTTGTLFIATKANRSAQIMIESGEIVFIYFFNKRGQEALELMSTIKAGKYRFQAGKVTSRREPLPKTSSMLKALAGMVGVSSLEIEIPQSVSGGVKLLNYKQKTVLKECLAEYIGPIAAIVCEDHLNSTVDFSTALDLLAGEISFADQREQFREKVLARIG